jgi:hypothetical protein
MMKILLIFLISIPLCSAMLVGPEMTFTSKKMLLNELLRKNGTYSKYNTQDVFEVIYQSYIKENYSDVSVKLHNNSSRYYIELEIKDLVIFLKDDVGVIEATFNKSSLKFLKNYEILVSKYLFEHLAKNGFKPTSLLGGGEVNLDIATFFINDLNKIANFLADMMNHPGLFAGPFENDLYNSAPFQYLPKGVQDNLENLFKQVHSGKIKDYHVFRTQWNNSLLQKPQMFEYIESNYNQIKNANKSELVRIVKSEAFSSLDAVYKQELIELFEDAQSMSKKELVEEMDSFFQQPTYHPIALHNERVEIKGIRAQSSFKEFIQYSEILINRARYTNELTGKLLKIYYRSYHGVATGAHAYSQWWHYLADARMNPDNYKNLLPWHLSKSKVSLNRMFESAPYFRKCIREFKGKVHKKIGYYVDSLFPD